MSEEKPTSHRSSLAAAAAAAAEEVNAHLRMRFLALFWGFNRGTGNYIVFPVKRREGRWPLLSRSQPSVLRWDSWSYDWSEKRSTYHETDGVGSEMKWMAMIEVLFCPWDPCRNLGGQVCLWVHVWPKVGPATFYTFLPENQERLPCGNKGQHNIK